MKTDRRVSVSELHDDAHKRLDGFGDSAVSQSMIRHHAWRQMFPNSRGPFKGGIAMNAFWDFQMDAFVIPAQYEEGPVSELAVMYAGGRFVAIVDWLSREVLTDNTES